MASGRRIYTISRMGKKFHIITYGCQMNKYDSDALRGLMESRGHRWAESVDEADIVIVNTCAVRQHAEDRALGRIEEIIGHKKRKPNLLVGIMGCVAQEHGERLFEKIPGLDFVVGTDNLDLVADIAEGKLKPGAYTSINKNFLGIDAAAHIEPGQVSAFVTIMRGCDNFCSYCIVPYVRGRERSLPPERILRQVRYAVSRGVREITLLGQNVNSYRWEDIDFPALLDMVAQVEGVCRLRFVTNHPKDFTPKILDVVEKHAEKIPPAFHLPLQSGSDRILRLMNRKYTLSDYMRIIEEIYRRFPDAAITTDIIVGFPTETERDFEATLAAMRDVGFAGVFAFKYSVRPGTAAAKLEDDVPEPEKIRRLRTTIDLGIELARQFSQKHIGKVFPALVEKKSPKNPGKLAATLPSGRTVLIDENSARVGDIVPVRITDARVWVLGGEVVEK